MRWSTFTLHLNFGINNQGDKSARSTIESDGEIEFAPGTQTQIVMQKPALDWLGIAKKPSDISLCI